MRQLTVEEGSGKVIVRDEDDRGTVYSYTQPQPFDLRRIADFVQVGPLINTQGVARGQLLVSADVVAGTPLAGNDHLYAEFQIVGYLGSTPTIVARGALSRTQNLQRFRFTDEETFDSMVVEARQVIDGSPNGTLLPDRLQISVQGKFWR